MDCPVVRLTASRASGQVAEIVSGRSEGRSRTRERAKRQGGAGVDRRWSGPRNATRTTRTRTRRVCTRVCSRGRASAGRMRKRGRAGSASGGDTRHATREPDRATSGGAPDPAPPVTVCACAARGEVSVFSVRLRSWHFKAFVDFLYYSLTSCRSSQSPKCYGSIWRLGRRVPSVWTLCLCGMCNVASGRARVWSVALLYLDYSRMKTMKVWSHLSCAVARRQMLPSKVTQPVP